MRAFQRCLSAQPALCGRDAASFLHCDQLDRLVAMVSSRVADQHGGAPHYKGEAANHNLDDLGSGRSHRRLRLVASSIHQRLHALHGRGRPGLERDCSVSANAAQNRYLALLTWRQHAFDRFVRIARPAANRDTLCGVLVKRLVWMVAVEQRANSNFAGCLVAGISEKSASALSVRPRGWKVLAAAPGA
jgi:hypothetical protein